MTAPPRTLGALLERVADITWPRMGSDPRAVELRGIAASSDQVKPGDLFVAMMGSRTDGHSFIEDAIARGAVAILAEHYPRTDASMPVLITRSTRRVFAQIAAAWYGHPDRALRMVGITGTLGKTSTIMMLSAILEHAGRRIGTIGSLGIRVDGDVVETGHTVPDPLALHAGLARIAAANTELAAMEVTSHALDQERVHGLRYELGIFTNLVPMEHADYHASFREYVAVKCRFLDHLAPGAPLVYSRDDAVLRGIIRDRPITAIGCGVQPDASVRIEPIALEPTGTRLALTIGQPLAGVNGRVIEPQRIEMGLPLLGRSNLSNAALAVTGALCLGVDASAAAGALATIPPSRRRMEIIHRDGFTVLDDTIGHPDSLSALFDVVQQLSHRQLHVVFAVRGSRGEQINRLLGQTLAIWLARVPTATLVVTRSADTADARNRVEDAELEAFVAPLIDAGVELEQHHTLEEAMRRVIDRVGDGDLVLLTGAQGMDQGAEIFRRIIA